MTPDEKQQLAAEVKTLESLFNTSGQHLMILKLAKDALGQPIDPLQQERTWVDTLWGEVQLCLDNLDVLDRLIGRMIDVACSKSEQQRFFFTQLQLSYNEVDDLRGDYCLVRNQLTDWDTKLETWKANHPAPEETDA